jgi:hypothetical protein
MRRPTVKFSAPLPFLDSSMSRFPFMEEPNFGIDVQIWCLYEQKVGRTLEQMIQSRIDSNGMEIAFSPNAEVEGLHR